MTYHNEPVPDAYIVNFREETEDGQIKNCVIASLEPEPPMILSEFEPHIKSRTLIKATPVYAAPPVPTATVASVEGLHGAFHASAPSGYMCADCTMSKDACPTCYTSWWKKRHPNYIEATEISEPSQEGIRQGEQVGAAPDSRISNIRFPAKDAVILGAVDIHKDGTITPVAAAPTPRTDANEFDHRYKDTARKMVYASFARRLETELAAAKAQVIWVHDIDGPPVYKQGNESLHELMSVVTAAEVQHFVNRYMENWSELQETKAALAAANVIIKELQYRLRRIAI